MLSSSTLSIVLPLHKILRLFDNSPSQFPYYKVRDHLIGANFNFPERSQPAVARTNKPNKRLRLAGEWPPEDKQKQPNKTTKRNLYNLYEINTK